VNDLSRWIPKFTGKRILVLGDLCLDEYIVGKAQRLSREAPVPVLEFQERFTIPGAACNPARNCTALGAQASVAGVVGDDDAGRQLIAGLQSSDVGTEGVVVEAGRATTLKMRVLASHLFPQQVARVDLQQRHPLARKTRTSLAAFLRDTLPIVDAVLVSDYLSGVVDASLMRVVREAAQERGALVAVDAQGDFPKFKGVALFRCNREEAEAFLHQRLNGDPAFARAGLQLKRRLGVGAVVITRGSDGMSLVDHAGRHHHIPAVNRSEVFDVTGAGDTVIAVLTLSLAVGASPLEASMLANIAAGLVVRKLGNATPSQEELTSAVKESAASLQDVL